ncbi:MAG: DUF1972 domain-containing protein [Bacteroidota bacterium]
MKDPNKKLGIIGTVGVPAKYGGFETLVHYLVKNLNQQIDITVYASKKAYSKEERVEEWNGAKLKYIPLKANGIQSIFYDIFSIFHALIYCDVLLVLGVSGCIILPFVKLFSKKKIIVNIDGLEWRRPKWNKAIRMFLLFSERIACKYADEIVTDNQILKEYVKIRYNTNGRLIEYGADHNAKVSSTPKDFERYPFLARKYGFKVSRIEPENNIHVILDAFSAYPEHELVLVGNWDNSSYGRKLKAKYKVYRNLHILDPIYELEELNLLRSNAHYYVHGHSAGGTNPSLVEAMYLELPVLSFDVIYNRCTTNNEAIFFSDGFELQTQIRQLDQLPLRLVARKLKRYAEKKYLWRKIAYRYAALIQGTHVERTTQHFKAKTEDVALSEY